MIRDHERKTAEHFDILDSIERLRSDLMDMVRNILECAGRHSLTRIGDPIEDYGSHLYFVTNCPWLKEVSA